MRVQTNCKLLAKWHIILGKGFPVMNVMLLMYALQIYKRRRLNNPQNEPTAKVRLGG